MHKILFGSFFFVVAFSPTAVPMGRALRKASTNGDIEQLRILLTSNDVDVNTQDLDDWTPLHCAATEGHLNCAQELLKHGANVNAQDDGGQTPLHQAAINGNLTIVQEFLKNHATININAKNVNNWTPLHCAAKWSRRECVEELLQHGADFEAKTNDGKTAKYLAEEEGHSDIVELLQNYEDFLEIKEPDVGE